MGMHSHYRKFSGFTNPLDRGKGKEVVEETKAGFREKGDWEIH